MLVDKNGCQAATRCHVRSSPMTGVPYHYRVDGKPIVVPLTPFKDNTNSPFMP